MQRNTKRKRGVAWWRRAVGVALVAGAVTGIGHQRALADTLLGYSSTAGGLVQIDPFSGVTSLLVAGGGQAGMFSTTGAADRGTGNYTGLFALTRGHDDLLSFHPDGTVTTSPVSSSVSALLYGQNSKLYGTANGDPFTPSVDVGELTLSGGSYSFTTIATLPTTAPSTVGGYAVKLSSNEYFAFVRDGSGQHAVASVDLDTGAFSVQTLSNQNLTAQLIDYYAATDTFYGVFSDDATGTWSIATLDPVTGQVGALTTLTDVDGLLIGPSAVDQSNGRLHFMGLRTGALRGEVDLFTVDLTAPTLSATYVALHGVVEIATLPEAFYAVEVPEPAFAWLGLVSGLLLFASRRRAS